MSHNHLHLSEEKLHCMQVLDQHQDSGCSCRMGQQQQMHGYVLTQLQVHPVCYVSGKHMVQACMLNADQGRPRSGN